MGGWWKWALVTVVGMEWRPGGWSVCLPLSIFDLAPWSPEVLYWHRLKRVMVCVWFRCNHCGFYIGQSLYPLEIISRPKLMQLLPLYKGYGRITTHLKIRVTRRCGAKVPRDVCPAKYRCIKQQTLKLKASVKGLFPCSRWRHHPSLKNSHFVESRPKWLNRPSVAAMRSYVKLLWPLVINLLLSIQGIG